MLNYGVTGGIKADWSSSKHNVQSLLALKREIFWVPTRMGCASPGNRSLIQDCLPIMNVLPTHLKPLIIGLPASKGTLTIERAFKPISGLEAFIKKRVQSDYFQRRLRLAQAAQYVHSVVYHDSLVLISEYKPAKKLLRYFNLMYKHNLSAFTRLVGNKDAPITTPIDLEPLERDVGAKFPVLYFGRWTYQNRISDTAIKQWAAEVARYTGN
jgi:hypothetical protein